MSHHLKYDFYILSCKINISKQEICQHEGHNVLERWTPGAVHRVIERKKGKWVGHSGLFKQFCLWCSYQMKGLLTKPQEALNRRNEMFWKGKADHKIVLKNFFIHLLPLLCTFLACPIMPHSCKVLQHTGHFEENINKISSRYGFGTCAHFRAEGWIRHCQKSFATQFLIYFNKGNP